MQNQVLDQQFYTRSDVVTIARELLGKELVTLIDGKITSGIITETEAYAGVNDRASHAWGGRFTKRTSVMFQEGGVAYVYLCYGIHALFNVVTSTADKPHAVLIRSIQPLSGLETMLRRSGKTKADKHFGIGPGKVSRLLGINTCHTGLLLKDVLNETRKENIFIRDIGLEPNASKIITSTRIGVDYAGDDALLPYRFSIDGKALK